MLRFIVYRYISYKDSKISHASLLALRHHLSLLHPALHRPHSPTTYPCPTPPSPTTHLTAPPPAPALLHYSAIYPRSAYPTYVHTTPYPLLHSHLLHILSRTLHTPHTPHTPHTRHTALPISPTDVPCHLYPIGTTIQPYLGHLYPPFSSDTFIGLIRPIAPIRPIPTRARVGQVVGVIGLIPP